MIEPKKASSLIDQVLSTIKADGADVIVLSNLSGLTRFANSEIHQNVEDDDTTVLIRAAIGNRLGVTSTNDITKQGLKHAAREAADVARHSPENPGFAGLASPSASAEFEPFAEDSAAFTVKRRAAQVAKMVRIAKRKTLNCAGYVSQSVGSVAFGNSKGVSRFSRLTQVGGQIIAYGPTSSGLAERSSHSREAIDFQDLAREAVQKAVKTANPAPLEPGVYPVVLDAYATADCLAYMAYVGFNAKTFQEQRSFLNGRMGEPVFSPLFHLSDDAYSTLNAGLPFDFEGVPRQRVSLVEAGVVKSLVHDSMTAAKDGQSSTGHALPPPNPYGPIPLNLVMRQGESDLEALIASVERGVFVTRFHYTNLVDPKNLIVTGMTRDGTFLIQNGKLKKGIRNFRFTQNLVDAFKEISMVSNHIVCSGEWVKAAAPAVKIDHFNFDSATEF
ncbi:MAG: TldD/PmbA family protein [bacterium]